MYDLQIKVHKLLDGLTTVQNTLKQKLDSKRVSYPQEATIRKLISLIPLRTLTPINLYQSLSGHTAVNISDSEIMFCGGSNNIQKLYNTNNNTFVSKQNYPNTANEHAGAKWGNNIYYTGGTSTNNKTYAYNIQSNTFTTKVNIPINIAYHTFVSTNRYLLLSGGYHNGDKNSQYTYDASSNTYSSKRTLQQPTDHHSTAHIKNEQVLINGGNDSNNSTLNYIFDINTGTIHQRINLNTPRALHKSLKVNDNLILINGGRVTESDTTQVFDVNANIFTNKKASPITWSNHTLSKVGMDFLISGGDNNKQYVYSYQKDTYLSS